MQRDSLWNRYSGMRRTGKTRYLLTDARIMPKVATTQILFQALSDNITYTALAGD